MTVSLTSRLKQIIAQIEKYPFESMDIDISVPYPLKKKCSKFFLEEALKEENGDYLIQSEITSNGIEHIIRRGLFKLNSIGKTYESEPHLIESTIEYILRYIIKNYPSHLSWSPINIGIHYPSTEIEKLDLQLSLTRLDFPDLWEELHYGIENALFVWSGKEWAITSLGHFFKTLSIPTGSVFLLMLECYLNVPERNTPHNINPWHMSKAFLKNFLEKERIYVSIADEKYDLLNFDPNMSFINRLDQFHLTNTLDKTLEFRSMPDEIDGIPVFHFADNVYETTLTNYGKDIIRKVVDESPNILQVMIESLINFELSGKEYFHTVNNEILHVLKNLIQNNKEIILDQNEPLKTILEALSNNNFNLLILRSLPPTIEKVMKNILIKIEELDKCNDKITLAPLIKKFEELVSNGKQVLHFETIQYIKSIERNSILHGSISPEGEIGKALKILMINVIIKILEDYSNYKLRN